MSQVLSTATDPSSPAARILGEGEMADRVRAFDWAGTPLGPIASWSKELITIVNLTLASPSPARTMWGKDLILIYNDAYRPIPGPRHPDALGRPASSVYGESWPVVGPLLEKAMETGKTLFYEKLLVPLPTVDGMRDRFLNYSFNPIFEDGRIAGLFGSLQDVTGEVMAVRQLSESEARSSRILQSIGDAVIVTDAAGGITQMNPVAESLTGWTTDEARGKNMREVFRVLREDSNAQVESPVDKVHRLDTVVDLAKHTILLRRDGSGIPVEDSASPIRDGSGATVGVVLVFRDVSERRRAEHAVSAERRKVLEVLQQAPVFFALLQGPDHVITMTNPLYQRLVNYRNVLHKPVREALPDAVEQGYVDILDRVYQGEPFVGTGLRYEVASGDERPSSERFVDFVYQPLREADGTVSGIIVAGVDVTDRKNAQDALVQSEKLAAVGRLASSIAHEINNPLESVTNLLYLMRTISQSPQMTEYIEIADRELRRVSTITNQTLRFHKQAAVPTAMDAHALIDSVLTLHQGRLINSRVTVERREQTTEATEGFEGEIRQVLSNMIGNATDAMRAEGGRLLLRTRNGVDWRSGRRGLFLTVADTGTGMSPATVEQALTPFFTTKGFSGTGLGLWISKEIVEKHNGTLRLRSSQREGHRGTVLRVFLPGEAAKR